MAANFWTSSHSKQLLDGEDLARLLPANQELGLTLEDIKILKVHFTQNIKVLAQQAKVRQRVVATACAYFRRVYVNKSFAEYDPRLVAPSCLYLASKVEESTVQAKLLVFYMKKLWPTLRCDIRDILEMEMHLLDALNYRLVVFHPFRPLILYLQDAGASDDFIQVSWSLLSDLYRTDICLMYSPYIIALGCIHLASVLKEKDMRAWFEDLKHLDMNAIRNISMELLDFYDNYRVIPNDRLVEALNKLPSRS